MAITIDQQRKYDLIALLISFGESIVYHPHQGPARTITAVIKRNEVLRDNINSTETVEIALVTVLRDAADTTCGGIEAPDIKDRIEISGDPERRQYSFTGHTPRKDNHGWTLEFKITQKKRVGKQNMS